MALKDEPSPKYTSCGRNVPSEILQRAAGAESYYNQFFTLLLLRLLNSLLPLLLPPPLLWLLLQLPAAKHHGPKGRTKSKMYVSRGRNVPSEILALKDGTTPKNMLSRDLTSLLKRVQLLGLLLLLLLVVPNGAF